MRMCLPWWWMSASLPGSVMRWFATTVAFAGRSGVYSPMYGCAALHGGGTLPLVDGATGERVRCEPPRPEQAPRARVLVVDNDVAVLKAMQALLATWPCEVHAARDAEDALVYADAQAPDLLLLDYHLDGGHDGLQLRTQLCERIGEVPTIVITADHSDAVRNAVRAAGCHLLHKPVKPLALKSLMNRLLAAGTGPRT